MGEGGFFLFFVFATTGLCFGADNTSSGCLENERRALLGFKISLELDTSGRLSSWDGNNCCQWLGVSCDNATGHVTRLDLGSDSSGSVEGNELNSSLAELTRLSYMDLSGIHFRSSPIPEFIGSMTQLQFLNLSSAGFSGVVPHQVGNLSRLRVLDLSDMELTVDDFTWFSRLLLLEHLDLSGATVGEARNFDKVLFYMIPSLLELRLSSCELSSSHFNRTHLDSNLTLSTIQTLDLSSNSFEGEFPLFLQNFTSLRVLDLSTNKLNSSIPVLNNIVELNLAGNRFQSIQDTGVWRLCRIKRLDLSFNYMEGGFIGPSPNSFRCARFDLETLILNYNKFNGEIPTSLERLTALRALDLSYSELTGAIPESVGTLTSLQTLDLSGNNLTGSIPTSLGNLTMLRRLDLSSNLLYGMIPFSLGRLTNLEILYLSWNSLSSIPLSLGNLTELQFLDLSRNLLQGHLPYSIGQLSKLQFLDISSNSLSGLVTEAHFANTSMLIHLGATSNYMLHFNISPDWEPPFQIRDVLLGSCKIASEFPRWIRTQQNLVILDLSNTSISGPLPDWLRKLPAVSYLDLSHNFLNGPLKNLPSNQTMEPNEFRRNFQFIERLAADYARVSRMLLLKNNLFNGSIPDSLCNATDLVILDLSRNGLSGTLPDCLGNLHELYVMILSSNRLSGIIPSSLGKIHGLQWLNLNDNSFHGELPGTLANCTSLNVLDLGENRFSGNIPKWIGEKFMSLAVLRLHTNNFTGRIPVELCECSELQIIDLGDNNLTGTIPRCFQRLRGMTRGARLYFFSGFEQSLIQVMRGVPLEYTTIMNYVVNIDLSRNNLVGEIPEEFVVLSGLLGLNLANNLLTGRIPDRIGDMNSLMSLDLSLNDLSGAIPQSISALTSLSYLNLSYNNLSGRIPTGSQLQTLIEPSIYAGNNDLCGSPLPKKCSSDEISTNGSKIEGDEDDDNTWIYAITSGFTTGFLGILGIVALKNRWRLAFFNFVGGFIGKKL